MTQYIRLVFLGISITISTAAVAMENPFKPLWEVAKATGIAQEQLKYSNDISSLIRNGNTYSLTTALMLKYGYNPFGDTSLKHLGWIDTASAVKDFVGYGITLEKTKSDLAKQLKQPKSTYSEMIVNGSIQIVLSIVAGMLLPTKPLKVLAVCTALDGVRKAYNGNFYQDYLKGRMQDHKTIEAIVKHAGTQLLPLR